MDLICRLPSPGAVAAVPGVGDGLLPVPSPPKAKGDTAARRYQLLDELHST